MTLFRLIQMVVAFGLLVFVHELGHFLAAKWAGVRVEVFSFGFGPFLLSFRKGDTIYAFSLVPVGGYVRMTGQADIGRVKDRDKTPEYSYLAKSPRRRSVIIAAGVVMNVLFAYFVFVIAQLVGRPEVPPVVGKVVEGMPAEAAGFRAGDRILQVNGRPIGRFSSFSYSVMTSRRGEPLRVAVRREGSAEPVVLEVTPEYDERAGFSQIGVAPPTEEFSLRIGAASSGALGVKRLERGPYPARSAGLEAYDVVVTVNGEEFDGLEGFKEVLRRHGGTEIELGVRRGEEALTLRATPTQKGVTGDGEPNYVLGFLTTSMIVGEVLPGSPAERSGLATGDFVREVITRPGSDEIELAWRRPDGSSGRARMGFRGHSPIRSLAPSRAACQPPPTPPRSMLPRRPQTSRA